MMFQLMMMILLAGNQIEAGYISLLGVRAPQNKSTNRNFKGVVKKIVIDDFDESNTACNSHQ